MKLKLLSTSLLLLLMATACRKYLDVNKDPANPQDPSLLSLMPPAVANAARVQGLDGIIIGQLIQNYSFTGTSGATWELDRHGGNTFGSPAPDIWRRLYLEIGINCNLMIEKGIKEESWDFAGVGLALKAWAFQYATDMCSEIIFSQAWEPGRATFDYNTQDFVYNQIDSMCRRSIEFLKRTDGKVSQNILQRVDRVYSGDRAKWIKFVYGMRARQYQRLSNKPNYDPDLVIKYCDSSFTSAADNFLAPNTATRNDDSNIFGPARSNFNTRLQSRYITNLLDGTNFFGNTLPASRDPRLSRMLSASFDTTTLETGTSATYTSLNGGYRSLVPGQGEPQINATAGSAAYRRRVSTLYGDSTPVNLQGGQFLRAGKYIYQNNTPTAMMTYHELQFIKAEASFKKADRSTAYTNYINGIKSHMAFVNFMNQSANNVTQITTAQIDNYITSTAVKQNSTALTLTDIMLQKYIADFGWNCMEAWCDIRRYHYFDLDFQTDLPVYRGFTIPTYSTFNLGNRPQYRFWPNINSEFDWNFNSLNLIGANNVDYHTYEMWFSQP
jgi:Starch-binding associating with outer membrane